LRKPLGPWIVSMTTTEMRQDDYIHKYNIHLITWNIIKKQWSCIQQSHTTQTTIFFQKQQQFSEPTNMDDYIPVDTEKKGLYTLVKRRHIHIIQQKETKKHATIHPASLQQALEAQQLDWQKQLLHKCKVSKDLKMTTQTEKSLIIVCDGGMKNNIAGYGVVCIINDQIMITTKNRVPDTHNDHTSYRSEAFGVLSSILMYKTIREFAEQHDTDMLVNKVKILCDNQSVIENIKKLLRFKATLKQYYNPDADVIMASIHLISELRQKGAQIIFQHIKGHQDRTTGRISEEAQLNVMADQLATESMKMKSVPQIVMPGELAYITINNKKISSRHSEVLSSAIESIRMRQYLCKSNNWQSKTADNIWWRIHGSTMKKFPPGERTTIQKFLHNRLASNYKENKYYNYKSSTCSMCRKAGIDDVTETQNHILQCTSSTERNQIRLQYYRELHSAMDRMGTSDTIIRVITHNVQAWVELNEPPTLSEMVPDPTQSLSDTNRAQAKIGWDNFIKGRIAMTWGELYNHDIQHSTTQLKFMNAERWGREIVRINWKYITNMWRVRNKEEYNDTDKKNNASKEKMIQKIMWLKGQIRDTTQNPYIDLEIEALNNLPISNLVMMEHHLEILKNPQKQKHTTIHTNNRAVETTEQDESGTIKSQQAMTNRETKSCPGGNTGELAYIFPTPCDAE
jgi:hypothetical protein